MFLGDCRLLNTIRASTFLIDSSFWFPHSKLSPSTPTKFREEPVAGNGYPFVRLLVDIFSIVDREDVNYLFFSIGDIKKPELADAVSPSIGGVTSKLLDVVSPKRFHLDLGVNKGVEFLPQKSSIAR